MRFPAILCASALAILVAAPAASAAPLAPVKISGLARFLPGGAYTPAEKPFIEGTIKNKSKRTIRRGSARVLLYLTRKATPRPSGRPTSSAPVTKAIAPGRSVFGTSALRFPRGAAGRYRLTFCVKVTGYEKRCSVVRGALNVKTS